MRQIISILLALSLSWVTTGYACQMDEQYRVRADCCCKDKHSAELPAETEKAQLSSSETAACCDVVVSSFVDQQQPAALLAAPALDLPVFATLPLVRWTFAAPVAITVGLPPPARGPPTAGTRTYLATARLRL